MCIVLHYENHIATVEPVYYVYGHLGTSYRSPDYKGLYDKTPFHVIIPKHVDYVGVLIFKCPGEKHFTVMYFISSC